MKRTMVVLTQAAIGVWCLLLGWAYLKPLVFGPRTGYVFLYFPAMVAYGILSVTYFPALLLPRRFKITFMLILALCAMRFDWAIVTNLAPFIPYPNRLGQIIEDSYPSVLIFGVASWIPVLGLFLSLRQGRKRLGEEGAPAATSTSEIPNSSDRKSRNDIAELGMGPKLSIYS